MLSVFVRESGVEIKSLYVPVCANVCICVGVCEREAD